MASSSVRVGGLGGVWPERPQQARGTAARFTAKDVDVTVEELEAEVPYTALFSSLARNREQPGDLRHQSLTSPVAWLLQESQSTLSSFRGATWRRSGGPWRMSSSPAPGSRSAWGRRVADSLLVDVEGIGPVLMERSRRARRVIISVWVQGYSKVRVEGLNLRSVSVAITACSGDSRPSPHTDSPRLLASTWARRRQVACGAQGRSWVRVGRTSKSRAFPTTLNESSSCAT